MQFVARVVGFSVVFTVSYFVFPDLTVAIMAGFLFGTISGDVVEEWQFAKDRKARTALETTTPELAED